MKIGFLNKRESITETRRMSIDPEQERYNSVMENINYIKTGHTGWEEKTRKLIEEYGLSAQFSRILDEALEIGFREEFKECVRDVKEGFIWFYPRAKELATKPGCNIQELEDASPIGCEVIFNRCLYFIEKGILVESHEQEARGIANKDIGGKGRFSIKRLEEILPSGLKKQFSNHLELIESGREDYDKVAITALDEARKYGYPEQAVKNAEAVGKRVREEIIKSAQITQKPEGLEIKIRK